MKIPTTSKFPILVLLCAVSGVLVTQPANAQRSDRDQDQNRYEQGSGRDSGKVREQRQVSPREQRQVSPREQRQVSPREQRQVSPREQRKVAPRYRQVDTRQPKTLERNRLPDRNVRTPSRTTPPPRGYVLDRKYNHDRYYPPRGYVAPRLPGAYRELVYHKTRYYFHGGVWYRRITTGFIVVFPPIGVAIPVLPPFYTIIWVGSIPYYYANGIYYVWYPARHAYVVTSPPSESVVSDEPAEPEKLFIYPKRGQSEQQQAEDRYQCYQWATRESGYDPTRAGGNVPEEEYFNKREDYQRAMKACLEARGYSVK
jgi:hypothetical protein